MINKVLVVLGVIFILGCSTTKQLQQNNGKIESKEYLRQLLNHLPARDSLQAGLVYEAILNQGSNTIVEICYMLKSTNQLEILKAQYALSGIAGYVSKPGRSALRTKFLTALHQVINYEFAAEQKAFLFNQLQLVGNEQSISLVSQYLHDENLCDPACQVIVAINSETAGKSLHSNLLQESKKNKISIIRALGEIQYLPAGEDIMIYAADEDDEVRMACLYALADIGYQPALPLFMEEIKEEKRYLRNQLALLNLQWAKQIEDKEQLISLCHKFLQSSDDHFDANIRISALTALVEVQGEKSITEIMSFLDEDKKLRIAALELTNTLPGQAVLTQLMTELEKSRPEVKCEIIEILEHRGDYSAFLSIISALQDQEKNVRLSAVSAAAKLGGIEAVPHLLKLLMKSYDIHEHSAVKENLLLLDSPEMTEIVAEGIPLMPAMAQITCMEILAQRKAQEYRNVIWKQVNNDSLNVRLAALNALKDLAHPTEYERALAHLIDCANPQEKKAAQILASRLADEIAENQRQIDPIRAHYMTAAIEDKQYLLNILKHMGGKQALQIVVNEAAASDSQIKDWAIRSLTDWPDEAAIKPLMTLAGGDAELTYKILAIRGVLRILRERELGMDRELAVYSELMALAERSDEKKLILAGMASIKSPDALKCVAQYISDKELSLEAVQSALIIATGEEINKGNLRGDEVALALIEYWTGKNWREQLLASAQEGEMQNQPSHGFTALFNGKDLKGWKGLVENPVKRAEMSVQELRKAQAEADELMNTHWKVINGVLYFDGGGHSICTARDYGDFELLLEWKIERDGDSGIYLRGTPQVQIWDPNEHPEGSGGLFNNEKGLNKPLLRADNPVGKWNSFRIIMRGEKVTVYLNDSLVVDNVVMENYWQREKAIYPTGPIELQAHQTPLYFRNIFIKELPPEEQLFAGDLFNGKDLSGWQIIGGDEGSWKVKDGVLFTEGEGGGWLSTIREFGNFKLELEFRVPPAGNSGVFIRAPHQGDPAYSGMEIQVLDDYAEKYSDLKPWQYTGSIYGIMPPAIRASKKANQWQKMEILCNGPKIEVMLNGQLIIDANLIDHMNKEREHPGLKRRKGFIGLQNHSSKIEYRNIYIEELD